MVADVLALQQHGLVFKVLFVSRTILSNVYSLADLATRVPIHHSWVHPAILRTLCSNASFDRYPQKKRYFVLLSFFFFFVLKICVFFLDYYSLAFVVVVFGFAFIMSTL